MIRKKTKHYSNTTRIPLLVFRLSGVLLLRFAQRTLFGSLFQEPPRKTRKDPELPIRPLQRRHTAVSLLNQHCAAIDSRMRV